jgi:hypothetical protein
MEVIVLRRMGGLEARTEAGREGQGGGSMEMKLMIRMGSSAWRDPFAITRMK